METIKDQLVITEMRDALVALAASEDTPKAALVVLPANINKRFAPKKKSATSPKSSAVVQSITGNQKITMNCLAQQTA
ncbi:hypothetical protein D3C84_1207510 [compost metagenome]